MKLKTVVIDDSSIQRMAASFLVAHHPALEVVGEFADPIEGIDFAMERQVDLVIIDVLYKDFTAFDLIGQLSSDTGVILNSSWVTYANRARMFPLTEFVLKPLKRSTLEEAVDSILLQRDLQRDPLGIVNWG